MMKKECHCACRIVGEGLDIHLGNLSHKIGSGCWQNIVDWLQLFLEVSALLEVHWVHLRNMEA
jgi:hypothetical protein